MGADGGPVVWGAWRAESASTLTGELIEEGLPLAALVDTDCIRAHLAVVALVGRDYLLPVLNGLPDKAVHILTRHSLAIATQIITPTLPSPLRGREMNPTLPSPLRGRE